MRGFLFVFQLILPLQGLDEGFLGQILGVMNAADHAINLQENAAQMFGDKAFAQTARGLEAVRPAAVRGPKIVRPR